MGPPGPASPLQTSSTANNPKANARPSSHASDEGSEASSYLDSLEEGRTPLLGAMEDTGDEEDERDEEDPDAIEVLPTDYHAARESDMKLAARRRIPRERLKTSVAVLMLVVAATSNTIVLSYIHDIVPDTAPLPDFAFSHLPYWPWALPVSEYLMLTSFAVLMLTTFLHKHRWVVLRRIAFIGALLYFGRCLTMFVTQVPKADTNYYCSPKFVGDQRTFWNVVLRGLKLLTGLGLSIEGKHVLCGDYIYSGHTIVHVICYLFIREYSPRNWHILHYTSFLFSTVGVLSLLVSRGHYSIDVLVAYWISTRIFWQYHTMANIPALRRNQRGRNHLTKEFWFPLFRLMEGNVLRPVPRRYGLPFSLASFLPSRVKDRLR